jgi:hypothetical protein
MSEEFNPFSALFGNSYGSMEELQAARQREQMESSAYAHDLAGFFRGLSREDMEHIKVIIYMAAESKSYANQTIGMLSAFAEQKFGICIACNKNHEEQLLPETSKIPGETVKFSKSMTEAEIRSVMKVFDLRFPNEGEVSTIEGEVPVICRNCNTLYQSLEDRMRRVPGIDGCQGCQIKSAHG